MGGNVQPLIVTGSTRKAIEQIASDFSINLENDALGSDENMIDFIINYVGNNFTYEGNTDKKVELFSVS